MFLYPPCCVHRDRRPDLTVSGAPSPRFVFSFLKGFLFLCFVSRGKRVRWPRALMPADRGRYPPPAGAIPSPPTGSLVPGLPLPQARRSREMPPPSSPSPPFAGDDAAVRGSPSPPFAGDIRRRLWLSQAHRLVLWFPGCRSPKPAVRGCSSRRPRLTEPAVRGR